MKLIYPNEFQDKDLKRLFRKFASIQNTILIDYKKLRDFLVHELKRNNKIEGTVDTVNPYMP